MPEIKDGVFAQVSGTVERAADGRFVIAAKLSDRNTYPDRVTVWQPDFPVADGDRIAVKGWLSWKKTVKDDKTFVDVSLNSPQLVAQESQDPRGSVDPNAEEPF